MSPPARAIEELIDLLTGEQLVAADRLRPYLAGRDPDAVLAELVRDGLLTAYQSRHLAAGNRDGLFVGKYRLLDRLGPSGSSVFRARKGPTGVNVAVKLLRRDDKASPESVERFRRAAEALARLDHQGIVNIKEFGEDAGRLFLVMDYIEGESLHDRVARQGPLPPGLAVQIVLEALRALAHIHQMGLVHRDLRPGHLMLDAAGRVRILDLGVARFVDDPAGALTRKYSGNHVLGSLEYLAPEQAVDSHAVDIRADIYALGATFYFLLAGKPPFDLNAVLRLASGAVVPLPPLGRLRPNVPRSLIAVIETMAAAQPADRYQTPLEAAIALQDWLIELPPAMEQPGAPAAAPPARASLRNSVANPAARRASEGAEIPGLRVGPTEPRLGAEPENHTSGDAPGSDSTPAGEEPVNRWLTLLFLGVLAALAGLAGVFLWKEG